MTVDHIRYRTFKFELQKTVPSISCVGQFVIFSVAHCKAISDLAESYETFELDVRQLGIF
jgi:hypothetical protein